ncbi:hypothetical protein [Nonlabens xiamenensis]|uniref:hypothetical protein n=1 Tax=Nonlabens xiamenensis TaxID=2341043 RepID=UPI000F60DDEB|nr:hypothetical protein [Nonlabens xiamenensis]
MIKSYFYIPVFLFVALAWAQNQTPSIKTEVDRDLIKIGEEVKLGLSVEVAHEDFVVFPEQPTMGALEVIESYPVDSLKIDDKIRLFKQYGVTQWDSGDYWLPRLKLLKNDQQLFSDSVLISVREVEVDTTKQKMFPIKPSLEIEDRTRPTYAWLWWLLLLTSIGLVVWALSRKREKLTFEETLQPYEWAKYRLQKLDESALLENRQWKDYYTELTYILRRYIDSKVYGHTLESTTGQLIRELKVAMDEKGMHITDGTQSRLEEILRKADLIKFASASGDAISAKEDRTHTNNIIDNIHQVLPPPTEEELMQDARYRRKQELKKRSEKIVLGLASLLVLIGIGLSVWVYIEGYDEVSDQVLGNELREAYDADWLTTTYGVPEISLSTPDVLVRNDSIWVPDNFKILVAEFDNFKQGDLGDPYSVHLTTMYFRQQLPDEELDGKAFTDPMIQFFENEGATNILMLDEPVEINGHKGIELAGNMEVEGDTYDYSILLFSEGGGLQQVTIVVKTVEEEDPDREYGRLTLEQIKNSIKIKDIQPQQKNQQ